ncbi:DUF3769 domain-containing protein [Calothrix sp. 336/3]|uniref:DUF3769 domain-containing protein n=1 Tax=Calothrix sp. 336/3 TaxID=1337936 RepID=UPI0004E446F7|nr:DUF3769 domain-containing protein [Calothrix sp. 336/3]AKG24739.1 organic solvent tolerance protein OstA [Calothrix sp. 336/3]
MLHPVLPPEPPAIVESLKPVSETVVAEESKQQTVASTLVVDELEKQPLAETEKKSQIIAIGSAEHFPTPSQRNQNITSQKVSQVSPPESLAPEFSPVLEEKQANFLGDRLEVGYPLQAKSQQTFPNSQIVNPAPRNNSVKAAPSNQEVGYPLQAKSQQTFPNSRVVNPSPRDNSAKASPSNQPVSIEFTAPNVSPQPSTPGTIEFKSRDQTSEKIAPVTIPPTKAPATPATPATNSPQTPRVVEVIGDRQEYDEQRRVVTAEGNVVVRFDGAEVKANRVQVNLDNLIAVGEGNVILTRGDQVLQGQRFTYNFVQDRGDLLAGSGEIFIPTAGDDFSFDGTTTGVTKRTVGDRVQQNQPRTANSPGGINIAVGGRPDVSNIPSQKSGGQVRRVRFQAARIDFYPRGWQARNVRLTNDPFSPPELELRADKVTLTRESPLRDRIKTQRQRLVLHQNTNIPIPIDERVIDRSERDVTPGLFSIGYDGDKRGGLFIERGFKIVDSDNFRWSVTPQFLAQKAIGGIDNIPSVFAIKSKITSTLSPQTTIQGSGVLTSLDLDDIENNLRGSLRLQQLFGDLGNPHILSLESSYRDRLYNGTLGFQTVQSSIGGLITSPNIALGTTGLRLRYQGGAQYINANTDRQDLLEVGRKNNRISLGRYQASTTLNGAVYLWRGKPLAATPTEGLRYTPNPVVPYLQAFSSLTGTTSQYSNGDNQSSLFATVGIQGQLGHFSRKFFDYTAFNVSYVQGFTSGESPFLFDRIADRRVLNFGISQQIYGPLRAGFQTSINLDTGERSSTDYLLEYTRRSYGITLRYNPVLELGGITFRISDFNWTGGTDPFSDNSEVKPVVGGVTQE